MGVITQKDIIKIINSSVDNIQVVVDTLATNISKVTKSTNTATLKNNLNLFTEIEKFINEYVKVMDVIISTIPKLKFSKLQAKLALKSIKNVVDTILGFVNSLSDDAFKKFDSKTLLTRLADIRKIVVEVESLFKSTASMAKNSLVIVLFGWMVKLSIHIIISIVKTIIKLSELSISKDKEKAFMKLKNIFDGIYDISKKLIKLIPLSIVATIGAMVTVVFVLELCVFVLVVSLLSKTLKFVNKAAVRGIRRLSRVFKALIWVSIWILILAISAPAVSTSLLIVISLVLILMLSIAILAITLFLTNKLSKFARKYAIRIAWNVILITGIFIIMCLAIVLAGIAGKILMEDGAVLKILAGLGAIVVMLGLFIVIGMIMGKAKKHLTSLKTTLMPLLVVLGLIALLTVEMVALALFGEFLLQGNNIVNIIAGLVAVIIVGALVTVLGVQLSKATKYLVIAQAAIMPLIMILGLLTLAGVALVVFAATGAFVRQNVGNIIAGLVAVIIVGALVTVLGVQLSKAVPYITISIAALTSLLIVFGLLVVAGLSIVAFGEVGKYLDKNILYVLVGMGAIIVVAGIMVGLGMALTSALPLLSITISAAIPLIIVVGLLVVAGLSIVMFGKIGQYLEKNILYVIAGFAAIISVAYSMIDLGLALTAALPFMVLTLAVALIYSAAMGLLIVIGLAINKFGETDLTLVESAVLGNIASVISIGLSLAGLGVAMIPIAVGCTLLMTLITPLLSAVLLVALAVKSIEIISNAKIDNTAVDTNIQSISSFWESVKTLLDTFTFGDLFLFDFYSNVCSTIAGITLIIEKIAERLQKVASIELNDAAILNNVEKIFSCITELATKIEELLNGEAGKSPLFEVPESGFFSFFNEKKTVSNSKLDNVKRILATLTGITYGLNEIQKFTLQENAIKNNVDNIFKFISNLSTQISEKLSGESSVFDDKVVEKSTWWGGVKTNTEKNDSFKRLDKVSQVMSVLKNISTTLNSIQKLTINEDKINSNVDSIFNSIQKICMNIKNNMSELSVFEDSVTEKWVEGGWLSDGYYEKIVEENQITNNLTDIEKVISSIGNIMESLKMLKEVKLTEDVKNTINSNIKDIFDYIREIAIMVDDLMNPKTSDIIGSEQDTLNKTNVANIINEKSSEYSENLGTVGQIFKTLNDILDSINNIKKIKFTQKDSQRIQDNIGTLFNSVEYIIGVTNERLEELGGQSIDTENLDLIVEGITKITDTVEDINNLKLTDFKNNTKSIVDFLTKLSNISLDETKTASIDKSLTSIATFLYTTDKAIFASNNRLTFMERVNGVIKSLGEVTPDQVNRSKEMIKHQIAYLDKVNNIDISKLKASAQMVESMAKLSNSIRGNFEGLAESINEDLMPVLKELKEIMGLIPEKLDTGFQNTSASIGAINNAPSQEGFAAQIRRENPNLSSEQTEAAAKSRMVDAARRLSGNRTITDLYNLFAGDIAGTKARVKIG